MNNPSTLRAGDHGAALAVLQQRLARSGFPVPVTGWYDSDTAAAVRSFQVSRGLVADGIAGPRTHAALMGHLDPRDLTQADLDRAAADLECDAAAIQAVVEVESPHGGYLPDGRVVILFERHEFWRQLLAVGIDPSTVVAPASILSEHRGGYVGGAGEYPRLVAAAAIHREAAYASASWGRFQIMGHHATSLGYASATAMAESFASGEAEQLAAFQRFVLNDHDLLKALRGRKWAAFARIFNGPAYTERMYDTRLARAYVRHGSASMETAA